MKSKIVTAIWMDVDGAPFQGTRSARKDRYFGSLISHCKGIELPIVCYTHHKNYDELIKLKQDYNLVNLTVKLLELTDMKLHTRIKQVRDSKFDTDLDGRGPEIMWGKFQVLEQELEGFDRVYWVDAGLQHPGIFPWMYCEPYGDIKYHKNVITPIWNDKQITQYNFVKLFNIKIFDKLNAICNDKIVTLASPTPQTSYYKFKDTGIIDESVSGLYPIGGLIGGDVNRLKEYIEMYWSFCDKILTNNFLCTEESIMKLVYDRIDNKISFNFDVHATNEHDQFHFELWNESWGKPKPLYMVWHEILNS